MVKETLNDAQDDSSILSDAKIIFKHFSNGRGTMAF
jgi:hypothetical protein